MKAVAYNSSKDEFSLCQLPAVQPTSDEAVVKVLACALNPVDTKIVKWHESAPEMGNSFVVGLDVVGEIVQLPQAPSEWKIGDRVLFHGDMLRQYGGLSEYTVQRVDALTHLPNVPIDVAASTPCAGWTAWRALVDRLNIQTKKFYIYCWWCRWRWKFCHPNCQTFWC